MQLKQGSVICPANKVLNTQWGEKQTVKVKLADGTEETIWFKVGKKPHADLVRGDVVSIIYEENNGKTIKRLIVNDDNQIANNNSSNGSKETVKFMMPNAYPKNNITEEEKTVIKEYITTQLSIYTHCLKATKECMESEQLLTNNEDVRTIATTLYIATQRKFNL